MPKPKGGGEKNGASSQQERHRPHDCSNDLLKVAADVQVNLEIYDRIVPGTDDERVKDDVFSSDVVMGKRSGCCDAVVAYKGTDTKWQWVLNRKLSTFPAFFSDDQEDGGQGPGKVHFGFLVYWLSTHSRVVELCRGLTESGDRGGRRPRVLITGMSLGAGGALAGLLFTARHVPEVDFTAIFFGVPRTGNRRYIHALQAQQNITGVHRVLYENDLVGHYPLPARFGGYKHPNGAWLHLRKDAARSTWHVHARAWALAAKAIAVLAVNKVTCGLALSDPWMDHDMEQTYHKGVLEYIEQHKGS